MHRSLRLPHPTIWIPGLYRKFLKDLHSEQQRADGRFPIIFRLKGILELPVCRAMQYLYPALLYQDFGSLEELQFYPHDA